MSAQERLAEIYDDLEANVVCIKNRKPLIQAVDLVYHSPLAFYFQGQLVQKGVVELLIVGDTRTGKSHVVRKLMSHYGCGEYVQGESVSLAGLLGGVDEVSKRRFLKMGRLPMCHRRMITIDEANEMDRELIGKLSGVRSTGVYDVMKITQGSFPALVRMIWIANTRGDQQVAEFACGVEAIPNVIGKPEDIARFDIAICLAQRDVDTAALYETQAEKRKVPHKYTAEACATLLRWVWSRKADQIIIGPETEQAILAGTKVLAKKYHSGIPLVIETEQRIKIARLSSAIAGRVYSHDSTGNLLIVRPEHVMEACEFIDSLYSSETMAYDNWSKMQRSCDVGTGMDTVCSALGKRGMETLLQMGIINKGDLCDIFNSKDVGNKAFHLLLINKGFRRERGGRRLTSSAIDFMKQRCRNGACAEMPQKSLLSMSFSEEDGGDEEAY
jgi:hypothetical protein